MRMFPPLLAVCAVCIISTTLAAAPKPNIVLIFVDNLGDDDRRGTGQRAAGHVDDPAPLLPQEVEPAR